MAMKIKNISKKIISIGELLTLPDQTVPCPAGYENNPTVDALVNLGFLQKIEEKTAKKGTKKDAVTEETVAINESEGSTEK